MCMCLCECVCVYVSRIVAQPNIFYWALLAALFIIRNNNSLHIFFFECVSSFVNSQTSNGSSTQWFLFFIRSLSWYCRSYDTLSYILFYINMGAKTIVSYFFRLLFKIPAFIQQIQTKNEYMYMMIYWNEFYQINSQHNSNEHHINTVSVCRADIHIYNWIPWCVTHTTERERERERERVCIWFEVEHILTLT